MISFFKKKAKEVTDPSLGILRYTEDSEGPYWEVLETPSDTRNSVEIDFAAVAGTYDGPDPQAIAAFSSKIKRPQTLWGLIDDSFISLVAGDFYGLAPSNASDHFYLRSLTLESPQKFEVGFHARTKDIFVEIFIENGVVANVERDDGCCTM